MNQAPRLLLHVPHHCSNSHQSVHPVSMSRAPGGAMYKITISQVPLKEINM